MSVVVTRQHKSNPTHVLEGLTAGRRRRLLAVLVNRSTPISVTRLATHLAAEETEVAVDAVESETLRSVQASLQHNHLPKLDELELVEWDEAQNEVAPTDTTVFEDEPYEQLLKKTGDEWDEIIACLANRRRLAIIERLDGENDSLPVAALARNMAARATDEEEAPDPTDIQTSLHHVHLPKLDGAGLVEYDRDERTVTYLGHDDLPAVTSL